MADLVIDVICENNACLETRINSISGMTPSLAEMTVEQWSSAYNQDTDGCKECGVLGVPYLVDASCSISSERDGRFLPLNVLGHSIFSPDFQQNMARGFTDTVSRIKAQVSCDHGCGKPALFAQPKNDGSGWDAVCDLDEYEVLGAGCPNAENRLIFILNLGTKQDGRCVRCGTDAVWTIDFPYSTQEHKASEEFGCGGSQCLYCGWRWNLGDGYVPTLSTFHFSNLSFPEWSQFVTGTSFELTGGVRESVSATAEIPYNETSYLVDVIYAGGEPDYGSRPDGTKIDYALGRPTMFVVPVYCQTVECEWFHKVYKLDTQHDNLKFGEPESDVRSEYISIWYGCGGYPCPSCDVLGAPFGDPFGHEVWGPRNPIDTPFHPMGK